MYVFKTSDTVVSKSEKLQTTVHYIREALRGNAKRRIDVIFLTHPSIKITSSVVMNAYLAVKNVDMSFQHNVRGVIVKPTHPPITSI